MMAEVCFLRVKKLFTTGMSMEVIVTGLVNWFINYLRNVSNLLM